jgi:hypothetical protein
MNVTFFNCSIHICIPDALDDLFHLLLLGSLDDIVGARALVSSDEVRVIDARQWHHGLHVGPELLLQINVQHLGPGHSISQAHVADVPATEHDVFRVHLKTSTTPLTRGRTRPRTSSGHMQSTTAIRCSAVGVIIDRAIVCRVQRS